MKLLVSAVEPSADALGASLVKALRARCPNLTVIGCGGPLLKGVGLRSAFDIKPFSVVGPGDALKVLPLAMRATSTLARLAMREDPNAAIFIDSWSFSQMAAAKLRRSAPLVQRIKYVAPQVWASRPHRANTFSLNFDALLCLFEFEKPYFEDSGVDIEIVGHSGFRHALNNRGDGLKYRGENAIDDRPLLVVLPGSRRRELKLHGRPFGSILSRLLESTPELQVVVPAAPTLKDEVLSLVDDWPVPVKVIEHAQRYDAFAAADAALAVSGTVTTELAIHNTPMVVCYKMSPLTSVWVDYVVTADFASLINITAGEEVAPEFVQKNFSVPAIANALSPLLSPGPARDRQISAFPTLIEQLVGGSTDPADQAAESILRWVTGNVAETC